MKIMISLVLSCAFTQVASASVWMGDTVVIDASPLNDVTVVAPRLKQTVTSGKPIQTWDRNDLELLGLTDMADAVRKFAGANVEDYGGIGGMKTVSIRNMGAQHTAVSYDGVTVSNTQAGQIDIGRYSLDNVQSLSLAIGDNNDLMQTARHLTSAGVLYIETEKPHFDNDRDDVFRVRVKGGSFGLVNPTLNYWRRLGDHTSLSFLGDYLRADGQYPFTLVNGDETTREKRLNSDIYSWRGEANLYQVLHEGELNVKVYGFYSERGLPGSVVLYDNVATERL